MSTFFKGLMRVVASAGAVGVVSLLVPALIGFFQGPVPSDVSPVIWGVVGTAAVFGLNWLVGKIKLPVAAE